MSLPPSRSPALYPPLASARPPLPTVPARHPPSEWEAVAANTLRLVVPGGWLYAVAGAGLCFVAEVRR